MEFHPYADIWPLLEGVKFDKLTADIKANGLLLPILTYQDKIIDGRNRYRACLAADVEPRFEVSKAKNDKQALLLTASMNEHRRHMSDEELAFVGEKYWTVANGSNRFTSVSRVGSSDEPPTNEKPLLSRDEAASAAGVSPFKVKDARAIVDHAPELKDAVLNGKKSLRAAADVARERSIAKKAAAKAKKAERQSPKRPKTLQALNGQAKLTRQMVDPEWTGDDIAWVLEYGLVHIQTSQERSTSRLSSWAISIGYLVKILREQQLPPITERVLHWLRTPQPRDVVRLRCAVTELEQALATAKKLLAKVDEINTQTTIKP